MRVRGVAGPQVFLWATLPQVLPQLAPGARLALVASLERHMGAVATVHGGSAGMHLALRFRNESMDDVAVSAHALEHGIVVNALSRHDTQGTSGWRGLMLGYAQVPAEQMDDLVKRLAAIVHLAAFAANRSR